MSYLKELIRGTFRGLGLRVTRVRPANRFQAMDETLMLMRGFGYQPGVVIDGGANVGDWTRMARSIFPKAEFHLIEPQPTCHPLLRDLVARAPGMNLHPVVVTRPGVDRVEMIGGGEKGGGTGAWVAEAGENAAGRIECPATTLDSLFADRVTTADRALLKLDLEGHELTALDGATRLLQAVEVILTELQFYEIHGNGRPVFTEVVNYLRDRGFELYDFACLSQRPRDMRLRMGDVVFVRRDSPLLADRSWE
jgi:FkbM family methyltransferase